MTTKPAKRRIYKPRMPRLSDRRFADVSRRWEQAVAHPEVWRLELAALKARELGYGRADAIFAAWGLNPETGK